MWSYEMLRREVGAYLKGQAHLGGSQLELGWNDFKIGTLDAVSQVVEGATGSVGTVLPRFFVRRLGLFRAG